jgi:hypothetical protein
MTSSMARLASMCPNTTMLLIEASQVAPRQPHMLPPPPSRRRQPRRALSCAHETKHEAQVPRKMAESTHRGAVGRWCGCARAAGQEADAWCAGARRLALPPRANRCTHRRQQSARACRGTVLVAPCHFSLAAAVDEACFNRRVRMKDPRYKQ